MQDVDLPPEMVAGARAAPGPESQFVAPTPGVTPSQRWLQKCSLAADHVAAGDFASAMRLLNRYLPLSPPTITALPPVSFADKGCHCAASILLCLIQSLSAHVPVGAQPKT